MLNLTENAQKELAAFFSDKPKSTVRVYLAPGGCSGPRLGLAIDDANDDDEIIEANGYTFCMPKEMWKAIGGLNIDVTNMGFTLDPTNPLPNSGGASSCCGGCGSGSTGCSTSGCGGGCH